MEVITDNKNGLESIHSKVGFNFNRKESPLRWFVLFLSCFSAVSYNNNIL